MADRALLHKSKLEDFKCFLDEHLIGYRAGKGEYQVLQVKTAEHGWQPIYEKLESPEHYSVPGKLTGLVRQFIREYKHSSRPDVDKGEHWFIRYPGGTTIVKVQITDVTERTVEVKELRIAARPQRYLLGDIEFVELTNGEWP